MRWSRAEASGSTRSFLWAKPSTPGRILTWEVARPAAIEPMDIEPAQLLALGTIERLACPSRGPPLWWR
jgi:hypothetical protein